MAIVCTDEAYCSLMMTQVLEFWAWSFHLWEQKISKVWSRSSSLYWQRLVNCSWLSWTWNLGECLWFQLTAVLFVTPILAFFFTGALEVSWHTLAIVALELICPAFHASSALFHRLIRAVWTIRIAVTNPCVVHTIELVQALELCRSARLLREVWCGHSTILEHCGIRQGLKKVRLVVQRTFSSDASGQSTSPSQRHRFVTQ